MFYSQNYFLATKQAGRLLGQLEEKAFPLNPIALSQSLGIKVLTYRDFCHLAGVEMNTAFEISQDGFSSCLEGEFFIVYNPDIRSQGRRRWTLLHELSHIVCGHIDAQGPVIQDYQKQRHREAQADELACCLVAPLPLILLCGLENSEEISGAFGISRLAADHIFLDYQRYLEMDEPPELGYGAHLFPYTPFALRAARKGRQTRKRKAVDIDIL